MAIIFINGFNSRAGGGKSILNNYLSLLSQKSLNDNYIVLTPDKGDYIKYENNEISIIQLPKILHNSLMQLVVYSFCLNKIIIKFKTDLVLNLADVPIRTSHKQVFLFDWAYAVYPESTVWKLMTLREWFHRKTKILLFKKYKKYINLILAQTETIKDRLIKIYDFKSVTILPNAVSIDNLANDYFKEFNLPDGVRLLYLTHYYSHKNIEIFIDLAKEIRSKDLDYKLIVTLEVEHNKKVSYIF
jgi:glycosyltransferase involved in cell wall biosynthesis